MHQLEQPGDLGAALGAASRPGGIASATLSPIVIRGSSEEYGSWNTICSGRCRPRVGTGSPSSRIRPRVQRGETDRGAGERGLAGAGLADEADDLAGRHGQADAVDGGACVP